VRIAEFWDGGRDDDKWMNGVDGTRVVWLGGTWILELGWGGEEFKRLR
jgi:hypothetical protein